MLEFAGRFSLSTDVAGDAPLLRELVTEYGEMFPELAADLAHRNADEQYRQAVTLMRERVRAARRAANGYQRAAELLADLRRVAESLRAQGERHVLGGDLHDVIRHVETFGFHLATMDIRDHSGARMRLRSPSYSGPGGSPRTTHLAGGREMCAAGTGDR